MSGAELLARGAAWVPFLAELAVKTTLLLMVTAGVSALLWRASAAVRHMVWCVGVIGVLALPVLAAVSPEWRVPLLPATAASQSPSPDAEATMALADGRATPLPSAALPATTAATESTVPEGTPQPTVASAPADASTGGWIARMAAAVVAGGVLLGALWLAAGFWGVARLGRGAQVVRDAEWLRVAQEASDRLGLRRPVLLLRSVGAVMPATWGLLWPSVVLPATAEAWPADRRAAVLAHELAHVKRFDCLTQALAQVACVLLWWHPAVWYAARRLRVERERACDDLVLGAGARASDYAAHLLEIARSHRAQWMAGPAMVSMARPSQLESRLLWVLDGARSRRGASARATLLAAAICALIVAPLAAMRPVPADPGPVAGAVARTPDLASLPEQLSPIVTTPLRDEHRATASQRSADRVRARALAARDSARAHRAAAAGTPVPAVHAAPAGRAGTRAARRDTIPGGRSIDELIALRSVGVDAAYLAEMRAAGYTGLTDRQLIAMKANGVTGAYAREMAGVFGRVGADELAALRALGVSTAYVGELRSRGLSGLSAEDVKAMRAVGVTAAYVDEMNAAGFGRLSAADLTALRAVGVTGAYRTALRQAGVEIAGLRELQGMRAVGVTPEYVAAIKAFGLGGLDAHALTGLRAVGVTPEYIRELASLGITRVTTEELTSMRAVGVTPGWIREMRAAGITATSPEALVNLRTSGVDRELVRSHTRQSTTERTRENKIVRSRTNTVERTRDATRQRVRETEKQR